LARALILAMPVIGLLLAAAFSIMTLSQPSEAEAKSNFEKLGCTACHRPGGIARPWDEIVAHFKGAAGKYASLDEFVAAEVSGEVKQKLGVEPKTWDELFKVMSQFSGKSRDDPGVKAVEAYLASLLGIQAPGTPTQPPATQTTPTTPVAAATPAEGRGLSFIAAAIAALIIVVAIAIIAYWLSRR